MFEKEVTGITAVYKTLDLIKEAYQSLRSFYKEMKLIVVDNSGGDECTEYLRELSKVDKNLNLYEMKYNIGHGDAVDLGLREMKTEWGLVFDSDVIFRNGKLLQDMFKVVNDRGSSKDIYGVGLILKLDRGGRRPSQKYIQSGEDIISYLYPALCLINKNIYLKFHKYTTFGLPPLKAMLEIHDLNLDDEILIDFPVWNYAKHISGATRAKYGHYEQIAPDDIKKREKLIW